MNQVAEREQRLHPAVTKSVISFDVEQIQKQRTARAGVNQNRQIRVAGGLVDRVEVRIIERPLSFDTAKENTDRAVVFAPLDLFHRLFDGMKRRHDNPAHAPARLRACLRKESVVRARHRHVQRHIVGDIN